MYCDCSDKGIDRCLYRSVDGMLKAVAGKDMQNWRDHGYSQMKYTNW